MSIATEFPGLFWDVDPRTVDEAHHAQYIIERVLAHGTLESVRTLLRTFPRAAIIDTVCRSRRISRRTGFFWQAYFDIKEPIACLAPRSPNRPSALWD